MKQVITLLVQFDGVNEAVQVYRVPIDEVKARPDIWVDLIVSGRSMNDVVRALKAAALESQDRQAPVATDLGTRLRNNALDLQTLADEVDANNAKASALVDQIVTGKPIDGGDGFRYIATRQPVPTVEEKDVIK
jgi:hypothetical protein